MNGRGRAHCVFAANDEMASGIIAGAIARNVSVPQDLGVVGFDDTRVAANDQSAVDDGARANVEHGCDRDRAAVPDELPNPNGRRPRFRLPPSWWSAIRAGIADYRVAVIRGLLITNCRNCRIENAT